MLEQLAGVRNGARSGVRSGVRSGLLAELAGYAGAAILAGGALLAAGGRWDGLGDGSRIVLLTVAAVVVGVAGTVLGGGTPDRLRGLGRVVGSGRRRLVGTLFTAGSVAAAGAAGVAAADHQTVLAAGLAGIAVAAAGYALVPTLLGQLACLGWAEATLVGVLYGWHFESPVGLGLATIGLGAVWAALAWAGGFAERYSALGAGAATVLLGALIMIGAGGQAWAYGSSAVAGIAATAVLRQRLVLEP